MRAHIDAGAHDPGRKDEGQPGPLAPFGRWIEGGRGGCGEGFPEGIVTDQQPPVCFGLAGVLASWDLDELRRAARALREQHLEQGAGGSGEDDGMTAPMPGKILEILCNIGDHVESGQTLIVMEAMKMEHRIAANDPGVVVEIHHQVGEQVDAGATLIDIEDSEESN